MAEFKKKRFERTTVMLDGNRFEGCEFNGCTVVFTGVADVHLTGSTFKDCNWRFDGPAARTAQFMGAMYLSGGGAQQLIEATFRDLAGKAAAPAADARLN